MIRWVDRKIDALEEERAKTVRSAVWASFMTGGFFLLRWLLAFTTGDTSFWGPEHYFFVPAFWLLCAFTSRKVFNR